MFLPGSFFLQLYILTNAHAAFSFSPTALPLLNTLTHQVFINWATKPLLAALLIASICLFNNQPRTVLAATKTLLKLSFLYASTAKAAKSVYLMLFLRTNTGLENSLAALHPVLLVVSTITIITTLLHSSQIAVFNKQSPDLLTFLIRPTKLYLLAFVLSSFWAYQELFWGSFWNWDPVEMSGLITLCLIGVVIHTLTAHTPQPSLSTVKLFILVAAGTGTFFFLNKSEVAQSVHSFSGSFFNTLGRLTAQITNFVNLIPLILLCPNLLMMFWGKQRKKTHLQQIHNYASLIWVGSYLLAAGLTILTKQNNSILSTTMAHDITMLILTAIIMYRPVFYKLGAQTPPTVFTKNFSQVPPSHNVALLTLAYLFLSNPYLRADLYTQVCQGPGTELLHTSATLSETRLVQHTPVSATIYYHQHPYHPRISFKSFSSYKYIFTNQPFCITTLTRPNNKLIYHQFNGIP